MFVEMVKTNNLVFKYSRYNAESDEKEYFSALKDVNLSINKGEFIAILGHNGSGKSTLAKHMNALLTPTEGVVYVKGLNTKDENNTWEIRHLAGMVFQNPDNQIVAAVVEEDVAFGVENLGVPSEEIRERVDDALKWVNMYDFSKNTPSLLSGGQKQRIAIAGILAMKPECIIFDEATAMLDPIGRKEVMQAVIRLNREEGITVIFITHHMDEAVLADRVVVMEDGEIVLDDVPKKIFCQVEKLKSLALDVPQVTELASLLIKKGINLPNDIITIDEMADYLCRLK
ncbi:MAG: energy-coupling factor transporter ATPase [Defluviitaleaceae bacterium]|nr:energy-coupling factor transporter ATPase [Defluviitaleaceae bacterium]